MYPKHINAQNQCNIYSQLALFKNKNAYDKFSFAQYCKVLSDYAIGTLKPVWENLLNYTFNSSMYIKKIKAFPASEYWIEV